MGPTVSPSEREMREDVALFAATYPTPAVRRAVALLDSGAIALEDVHALFHRALAAGLAEVTR